jgi:hypothetical protein
MESRIFEIEGVRTYGRNVSAARLALAIVGAVKVQASLGGAWSEDRGCLFADIVKRLIKDDAEGVRNFKYPAAYAAVSRALPFEHGGLVYQIVTGEAQAKIYEKTRRLIRAPGKLESVEITRAARRPLKEQVADAVAAAVKAAPVIVEGVDVGARFESFDQQLDALRAWIKDVEAKAKALEEKFALL